MPSQLVGCHVPQFTCASPEEPENFAGISERIGTQPVGVEILGEKVVLFRGSDGVVHCLHDICPHRGAPLHQGWVGQIKGHDCVVCPYHGWAFDEAGVLRDVPAAEHGEVPKLAIDAFPVEEKVRFLTALEPRTGSLP